MAKMVRKITTTLIYPIHLRNILIEIKNKIKLVLNYLFERRATHFLRKGEFNLNKYNEFSNI